MARLFFGAPSLASLMPPDSFERLRAAATPVVYRDGALIHARGDPRPGLTIVREGAVQIGNPGVDGSFVVTSVLGPGHCFGEMTLFGDLPRTHDAVAKGPTVIDQVSPAAYERVAAADPALTRAILSMMARRLHVLLEFADDLRRLPLKVQLAKLLLAMSASEGDKARVDATQEEMAAVLGVSRVAIGTALCGLEGSGLVKRGYGGVIVPDRAALRAWIDGRTMLAPI
jgi:CRP-like cAMP-binding protein